MVKIKIKLQILCSRKLLFYRQPNSNLQYSVDVANQMIDVIMPTVVVRGNESSHVVRCYYTPQHQRCLRGVLIATCKASTKSGDL